MTKEDLKGYLHLRLWNVDGVLDLVKAEAQKHRHHDSLLDGLLFLLKRLEEELEVTKGNYSVADRDLHELQAWGKQIHDALDGRGIAGFLDEAPARIQHLREALKKLMGSGPMVWLSHDRGKCLSCGMEWSGGLIRVETMALAAHAKDCPWKIATEAMAFKRGKA